MSGWGYSAFSRDFCKDGKCPKCGETLNVLSDTEEATRYECTACDMTFRRPKDEEVT